MRATNLRGAVRRTTNSTSCPHQRSTQTTTPESPPTATSTSKTPPGENAATEPWPADTDLSIDSCTSKNAALARAKRTARTDAGSPSPPDAAKRETRRRTHSQPTRDATNKPDNNTSDASDEPITSGSYHPKYA